MLKLEVADVFSWERNYWHVETYGYWDVYGCLDLLSAGVFALRDGFSVAGNGLIASIYSRFVITIWIYEHLCTTAKWALTTACFV